MFCQRECISCLLLKPRCIGFFTFVISQLTVTSLARPRTQTEQLCLSFPRKWEDFVAFDSCGQPFWSSDADLDI